MTGALSPLAPAPAGPLLGLGLGHGGPAVPGALSPLTPAPAGSPSWSWS